MTYFSLGYVGMTVAQQKYLDAEMDKILKQCAFMQMSEGQTIAVARALIEPAYEQVREAIRLRVNDPAHLN